MSGIRIIETTLSVLLLVASVRAAFTTSHCDSYNECVQKNSYGVWCFSTKYTSNIASCSSPWALPLQTHLNQNLSIAYYSPNGQFLGGSDYHVVPGGQTYLCMSARVDLSQSATFCGLAPTDNTWYIDQYCFVDVVPAATDGCLDGGPPLSAGSTGTSTARSSSTAGSSSISGDIRIPTQTASAPTSNALKDSHYAPVWGPILGAVVGGIVAAIVKKYIAEKKTADQSKA